MNSTITETCEAWMSSSSLMTVISDAVYLIDKFSDDESIVFIIESLLGVISIFSHPDACELMCAVNLVRKVGCAKPNIGPILVSHLALLPDATSFIDIIPSIMGVASPTTLEETFTQLEGLALAENRYMLPVISVLVDLPFPAIVKPALARLADEAIGSVNESDIPFLFRTILKNLSDSDAYDITFRLRKEMASLSESIVSLVVESLWDTLLTCPYAADCFLLHIKHEVATMAAIQQKPSLVDMVIILILCADTSGAFVERCTPVILIWLESCVFPFEHLTRILELKGSNEAWSRLTPSIWGMAADLLLLCAHQNNGSDTSRTFSDVDTTLHVHVQQLFLDVYKHSIECREYILRLLLGYCYATNSVYTGGDKLLSTAKPKTLFTSCNTFSGVDDASDLDDFDVAGTVPSVTDILASRRIKSSVLSKNLSSQPSLSSKVIKLAKLSSIILNRIVREHSAVISTVVSSLMERLHAQPSIGILREQREASLCLQLPCPIVLYRIIMTIVNSISAQPTTENTLLIMTQKLVGSCPVPDPLTVSVFFGSDGSASLPPAARSSMMSTKAAALPKSQLTYSEVVPCQFHYAPGAVGMMIAGALLKRLLGVASLGQGVGGTFVAQDMSAIFGWVQRIIGGSKDTSAGYAMDVLSLIATSICVGNCQVDGLYPALRSGFDTFVTTYSSIFRHHEEGFEGEEESTVKLTFQSTGECYDYANRLTSRQLRYNVKAIAGRLCDTAMNFVHREDRSLQATTLSEFCNSVWWLFHRVALVHGTLYSCEHRDPPNTCDVFIEVSPILHKTISSKANWLWKCCDEYKSCRPLYPNQNPAQNMRIAWECALSAALLVGYIAAGMQIQSPSEMLSSTVLGHALPLISRARYHILVTMRGVSSLSPIEDTSDTQSPHSHTPPATGRNSSRLIGLKRKGSPLVAKAVLTATSTASQANYENRRANLAIQSHLLGHVMNQIVRMVPVHLLVEELGIQRWGNSREDFKVLLESGVSTTSALFSERGLHCVLALCRHMLADSTTVSDDAWSDSFQRFEEVWRDEEVYVSTSMAQSSANDNAEGDGSNVSGRHGNCRNDDIGHAAICTLFSLMPIISYQALLERQRYLIEGNSVSKSHSNHSGRDVNCDVNVVVNVVVESAFDATSSAAGIGLDYPSFCLLISVLHLAINSYISKLQSSCSMEDKIAHFAADTNLTCLTEAFITATSVVEEAKSSNMDKRSFLHSRPVIVRNLDSSERLCALYKHIESLVLDTPHPVVALLATSALINLAKGTLLYQRIPSVLWCMVKSIHEYNKDSIFPYSGKGMEGLNGLLSIPLEGQLISIVAAIRRNGSDILFGDSDTYMATRRACRSLLLSAYATCLKPPQSGASSCSEAVRSEHEQFETFRLFWCLWWTQQQSYEDTRLYGTTLLVFQILAFACDDMTAALEEMKKIKQKQVAKKTKKKRPGQAATPKIQEDEISQANSEYAAGIQAVFLRHKASNCVVRRVCSSNFEPYLSFALSHLPTLLLHAKPIDPDTDPALSQSLWGSAYSAYCDLGPYRPMVHTMQLMILVQNEISRMVASPYALGNSATLLGFVIKVYKAFLSVIDVAVHTAVSWRSGFELTRDSESGGCDWKSVDYLRPLFESALACIEQVWELSNVISAKLLSSATLSAFPKSVSRSSPQLKVHAERAKAKLLRVADSQSLSRLKSFRQHDDSNRSALDWVEMMHTRAQFYDANSFSVLSGAPPMDSWAIVEQVRTLSTKFSSNPPFSFNASKECDLDRRDAFFVDVRGGASRWGEMSGSDSDEELSSSLESRHDVEAYVDDASSCGSSGDLLDTNDTTDTKVQ